MGGCDRLDIAVTIGAFATILGAGIFYFALGGAPTGVLQPPPQNIAADINTMELTQEHLGNTIVRATQLAYLGTVQVGADQARLGEAIIAAAQLREAERALIPGFQDSASRSQARMEGMIQERAGKSIVLAAQRARRATEAGQLKVAQERFRETLGSIQAAMTAMRQATAGQQQQSLGWMVVGEQLAMHASAAHVQQHLGSAVVGAGMTTAGLAESSPTAQESLGAAVLLTARTDTPLAQRSAMTASLATPMCVAGREAPLPAAVVLFAAVFVIGWGIRTIAQSAVSMPSHDERREEARYKRAG